MNGTGNPKKTGGFPRYRLMFSMEAVTYDIPERLKLIDTESNAVVPGT